MTVDTYYLNNRQYGNRRQTDTQWMDVTQSRRYRGVMDSQARFVETHQLFNQEDWILFVKQFQGPVDDADTGWRGEYFGKMMRGACMTWQYTHNEELYTLLRSVCEQMLACQDRNGRISTYSPEQEFNGWDMWSRKYVMLGLLHFHEICRDEAFRERIVAALERHLDYIVDHIGHGDKKEIGETSAWWGGVNSASILEPVMKMFNITGNQRYLEFARYILEYLTESKVNIFQLALEDQLMPWQYPVTKAYEMMSCFEGLLEYYRATGEEIWKTAVIRFADRVRESDITLIGCAGCRHELFNHAAATQTDTEYEGIMQETCVTVTWMKLCNQLLLLTGNPKYADCIEQSVYNALHGAVNNRLNTSNDGFLFDSYSPLTLGRRGRQIGGYKDISETRHYGCCAAIGAAGTALPLLTAVTATGDGVAINYYEAGSVCVNGMTLELETCYPADGRIAITVTEAKTGSIALRIPEFSGEKTTVSVNGMPEKLEGATGSFYVVLNREWKAGDRIELTLNMNPRMLRPCGMEEKPWTRDFFAVAYGPLVLARDAEVTEVGTVVPLGDLTVTPKAPGDFPCLFRADVTVGNQTMDMIDYASAGKTWEEDSRMEAWISCMAR